MKKRWTLLLGVLVIGCFAGLPREALAFSCSSNGVSIGGGGTFTIPVEVTLSKNDINIQITDLSKYTTCSGYLGWAGQGGPAANDALRTYGSGRFSPQLTALGFTGYAIMGGARYNFPTPGGRCIWPDSKCTYTSQTTSTNAQVNIQIGMARTPGAISNITSVAAGTEIARFTVEQRGTVGGAPPTWGNALKTWVFVLKNVLVVPNYTCSVTKQPNQPVTLLDVKVTDLKSNAGRYPDGKAFDIELSCTPKTKVSMKFEGTTMSGRNDVLANQSTGTAGSSVGIQMIYGNNPVTLGQTFLVVNDAKETETLPFKAHYYYNGGDLQGGEVAALTTFTFTYQ